MRLDEEPSEVSKRLPSQLSYHQPMLNPNPEPVVPAANEPDNIDQLKSTTSQRQSFKYKVPVLLPEQQKQLESYKIINSVDKQDTSPKPRAIRQQSYLFKLPHLYFIAMSILEITLMIVYGVYYGVQDKTQKQIGLGVLITVTSLAEGLLFAYIVFLRNLIDLYWGIVWISFMVNFLFAAIGAASGVWYISLIASGILLLIDGIALSFIRGKWQTFFLVIALAIYLLIWGIIITSVIQGKNKIDPTLITPEAVLVGFWMLVVAYQLTCKRKWRNRTCNQKWEFIASFYMMTVVFCFGIAIGVPGKYTWLYLTQVVNLVYIGCTIYFMLVVIETGKTKINVIDRILNFVQKSKTNPNHIYQMSDSLLTTSIHHYKNPPKQLINKPLSKCISCLTEQSRFYYQNCKHAVIGHQCVLDWIKKGSKKCPLCRELSLCLVQIHRISDRLFFIEAKYRFQN